MDTASALDSARIGVSVVILAIASVLDWRTRRVPNKYWIAMSALAIVIMVFQAALDGWPVSYMLVLIPIIAVLADVYLEPSPSPLAKLAPVAEYTVAIASVVVLGVVLGNERTFRHLLAIPVMMLLVVLLYMLDIVKGGADAKALIALSIMFPFYPSLGPFPLAWRSSTTDFLFPFALAVLFTGAIIVALMPLWFLAVNLKNGDLRFPQAFLGYKIPASEALRKPVWLMERIIDGKHVAYARPRPDEDLAKEVEQLVSHGHDRVWVTPKVPFMIPMLGAFVICALFGNVLLYLFPM